MRLTARPIRRMCPQCEMWCETTRKADARVNHTISKNSNICDGCRSMNQRITAERLGWDVLTFEEWVEKCRY